MNVYEADIWRSVYHNDKFSHTATRWQLIHALNEERAKRKITLAEEKMWESGALQIKVLSETIYSLRKSGTVTKQPFYVYSNGRTPRPVGAMK